MKYILTLLSVVFLYAGGAEALSWDSLVSGTTRSIKGFFTPSAVNEPAASPGPAEKPALPLSLPAADAQSYLADYKPSLLDVRTPEEYAAGHLEAAVIVDYYSPDFKNRLGQLDKTAKYLIYCRSGKRSAASLTIMQELGFTDIRDIAGGFNAWTAAGYPVVK